MMATIKLFGVNQSIRDFKSGRSNLNCC